MWKSKTVSRCRTLLLVPLLVMFVWGFGYTANSTADIREIKLRFCDGSEEIGVSNLKKFFFQTKPVTPTEICFELTNESREEVSLGINFVDGSLTADVDQKKACLLEDSKTNFGQYVTGYTDFFTIPAQTTIRETATVTFPDGYAGDSYGCITVHVVDQNQKMLQQDGQIFQVFSRLGYFLDAFVDGKFIIDVINLPQTLEKYADYGRNTYFPLYKNDKNFFIRSEYYNSGNITVAGNASIGYNYRGFFTTMDKYSSQQIIPKQSKILIKKIPRWYTHIIGGPFVFHTNYFYSPIYYGLTVNDTERDKVFVIRQKNFKFFTPWGPIVVILAGVIYMVARKKSKSRTLARSLAKKTSKNSKKPRITIPKAPVRKKWNS